MKTFALLFSAIFLMFGIASCTPLLVGGAATGGAYTGYKLKEKGYTIDLTKAVEAPKESAKDTKK